MNFQATGENIVGLAVDLEQRYLFWSDLGETRKGIWKSDLDGLNAERIIQDSKSCHLKGLKEKH